MHDGQTTFVSLFFARFASDFIIYWKDRKTIHDDERTTKPQIVITYCTPLWSTILLLLFLIPLPCTQQDSQIEAVAFPSLHETIKSAAFNPRHSPAYFPFPKACTVVNM